MSLGDWIALTAALGALVAGVAAVAAVWYQVTLARGTSSIDNMLRMDDQWQSDQMLMRRAAAATWLIDHKGQTVDVSDDVSAVMTFFEQVGYLVREKAIKSEAAWEAFSDWALPYWEACEPFVTAQQDINRTYWENFAFLDDEMLVIEARRRKKSRKDVTPDAQKVDAFLEGERTQSTGRSWRRTQKP
jgi:hypothetical protein